MNEKLVGAVMVPLEEYPCIPDSYTLRDAIHEMGVQILKEQLLSLPRMALVFDDSLSKLLGVLRRRDIMRGLEPRFMAGGAPKYQRQLFSVTIDPNLAELSFDTVVAGIRKRASRRVREFMIPIKATINHDDHIMKAVYEMVDQNVSVIPVMENNRVVGVVRSIDVLRELALVVSGEE